MGKNNTVIAEVLSLSHAMIPNLIKISPNV